MLCCAAWRDASTRSTPAPDAPYRAALGTESFGRPQEEDRSMPLTVAREATLR
jgi:hypothetical protein